MIPSKKRFLAVFLLHLPLLVVPQRARGDDGASPAVLIREVRFDGLAKLNEKDLLGRIESRPGRSLDVLALRTDLKRLGEVARRVTVRRDEVEGGVRLVFEIEENPTLRDVRFVGNSRIATKKLKRALRIRPGDVLARDTVDLARRAVLKEYVRLGYAGTRVRAEVLDADGGRPLLQVSVDEGRRILITHVVIEGDEHFSSFRLRRRMETKGSWLLFRNYFDDDAFDEDLDDLRRLYRSVGFLDARVSRGDFAYDETVRKVAPRVVVREGKRYRFGQATVRGNTYFTQEEILEPFAKLRGEFFNGRRHAMALEKATRVYGDAGYITTEISADMALDRESAELNLALTVTEKSRIRVGRILMERPEYDDMERSWFGRLYDRIAPPIKDDVIRRTVVLKPGDVYSRTQEERSIERLRRLNVFEKVQAESQATGGEDPAVRDMLIRLEEASTGYIEIGVGYAESDGGYALVSFRERNFLGEAGDLNVTMQIGTRALLGRTTTSSVVSWVEWSSARDPSVIGRYSPTQAALKTSRRSTDRSSIVISGCRSPRRC